MSVLRSHVEMAVHATTESIPTPVIVNCSGLELIVKPVSIITIIVFRSLFLHSKGVSKRLSLSYFVFVFTKRKKCTL